MIFDDKVINPNSLSPLTLAFVGDAVYSLIIREELTIEANRPVNHLHKLSTKKVSAVSQCEAIKGIMDELNDDELTVFKRGRNASTSHTPKNASEGDYHYATGFEALFGYLYLARKYDRMKELYSLICNKEKEKQEKFF